MSGLSLGRLTRQTAVNGIHRLRSGAHGGTMESIVAGSSYALGHSPHEINRLSTQAQIFEPFTRRMLQQAGVVPGMRVLDVGSGTGDVAFLCASLVGLGGEVIGMDLAAPALDKARERATAAGLWNVSFYLGDPADIPFARPFDVVVGRLVLMHQPNPVAALRKWSRLARRGGIVAFQELDINGARSFPPSKTFDQCLRWIEAAFQASGTDTRLGSKLYSAFIEAGLPEPQMAQDAGIWGGERNPVPAMIAGVMQSLLPALERLGIANESDVGIDSLESRIHHEILASVGIATSPSLISAWATMP